MRSATSASPFGRNAIPHGTSSPVATTRRAAGACVGAAVGVADGVTVGPGVSFGVAVAGAVVATGAAGPASDPHPASTTAASRTDQRFIAAAGGAPGA